MVRNVCLLAFLLAVSPTATAGDAKDMYDTCYLAFGRKAAKGDMPAQVKMGECYLIGQHGNHVTTEEAHEKAFNWLRPVAEWGDPGWSFPFPFPFPIPLPFSSSASSLSFSRQAV